MSTVNDRYPRGSLVKIAHEERTSLFFSQSTNHAKSTSFLVNPIQSPRDNHAKTTSFLFRFCREIGTDQKKISLVLPTLLGSLTHRWTGTPLSQTPW